MKVVFDKIRIVIRKLSIAVIESLKQLLSIRSMFSCLLAITFSFIFFNIFIPSLFPYELGEREILDPISHDWYVNTFFTKNNKDFQDLQPADDRIVIINIMDSISSRSAIAKTIRHIASQHPSVLGIDIFFAENNDTANIELQDAIKDSQKNTNLVVSAYWNDVDENLQNSFFVEKLGTIDFGLVNIENYTKLSVDYKGIPSFSSKILKKTGENIDINRYYVVNYLNKDFNKCTIIDLNNFELCDIDIHNKIVLLGNAYTPSDKKEIPFLVGGVNQISGIERLAYEINTLLALSKRKDIYQSPLEILNPFFNFILCFIALLIYLLFTFIINQIEKISTKSIWMMFMILFKLFILILCELVIISICLKLTRIQLVIPDITLFITSLVFVEEIYKKLPINK